MFINKKRGQNEEFNKDIFSTTYIILTSLIVSIITKIFKNLKTKEESLDILQIKLLRSNHPRRKNFYYLFLSKYFNIIKEVKPNVISLDEEFPEKVFSYAKKNDIILQGNLKPTTLIEGGRKLKKGIINILNKFNNNKHIFNLSHGVLPHTPVENVKILVDTIRNYNET